MEGIDRFHHTSSYSQREKTFLCFKEQDITLRKKGTKAVTGAVPFQKVNFCPF